MEITISIPGWGNPFAQRYTLTEWDALSKENKIDVMGRNGAVVTNTGGILTHMRFIPWKDYDGMDVKERLDWANVDGICLTA